MEKIFTTEDYVLGVWFVPGSDVDWLCYLWKECEGWAGRYRFRYYHVSDPVVNTPFSGLDDKSWYSLSIVSDKDEEAIVTDISFVADKIAQQWTSSVDFVPVRGDGEALIAALRSRPWAHLKVDAARPPAPH